MSGSGAIWLEKASNTNQNRSMISCLIHLACGGLVHGRSPRNFSLWLLQLSSSTWGIPLSSKPFPALQGMPWQYLPYWPAHRFAFTTPTQPNALGELQFLFEPLSNSKGTQKCFAYPLKGKPSPFDLQKYKGHRHCLRSQEILKCLLESAIISRSSVSIMLSCIRPTGRCLVSNVKRIIQKARVRTKGACDTTPFCSRTWSSSEHSQHF